MKIAIIMGRGIEGCGVTKFTVEQTKWLSKNGHNHVVFSSKDKSWTRKNAHDVSNVVQLKLAKSEETNKMIEGCNKADIVIINSLPSLSHPEAAIEQFKRAGLKNGMVNIKNKNYHKYNILQFQENIQKYLMIL